MLLFSLLMVYWYIPCTHCIIEESTDDEVKKGCWFGNLVPYRIVKDGFSESQIEHIIKQIDTLNKVTCLSWQDIDSDRELKNRTRYVQIEHRSDGSCSKEGTKYLPTRPGTKGHFIVHILLPDYCFTSSVLHELIHALGFEHEHQRGDRDCYVDVVESEVRKNPGNYKKIRQPWLERFPYDKRSIMHHRRSIIMSALSERFFEFETLGSSRGMLTQLDVWKIQYKFCGREHFCDNAVFGKQCEAIEEYERTLGCNKEIV